VGTRRDKTNIGKKVQKEDRMNERDVEKGGTEWKKKWVGDRKKNVFFWNCYFLDKIVCSNRNDRRANKGLSYKLLSYSQIIIMMVIILI
jgi:hypothetical protein